MSDTTAPQNSKKGLIALVVIIIVIVFVVRTKPFANYLVERFQTRYDLNVTDAMFFQVILANGYEMSGTLRLTDPPINVTRGFYKLEITPNEQDRKIYFVMTNILTQKQEKRDFGFGRL